ncbi:uncharacterized protein LOC124490657 [Dermatophagoides farinae]|uniref:uncharacterized protein LOC124490657 n=1 Tax=Dermatophagoides farinae TaxID=6954 RepID=UPI003F628ED3
MDSINNRKCRFFSTHNNSCVRSVAFNPKDRYLFCSGGNDGQIGIYHAGRAELLRTNSVISSGLNRCVSAVSFSSDGKKILATTSSRRVSVIDVEHGTPIVCYDSCAYIPSRDRTPLAVDPESPNIAACSYVNGKGVTILDLRMPLPLDFIFDFHTDIIRDIIFLHESWPFSSKSSSLSLLENNNNNNINDVNINNSSSNNNDNGSNNHQQQNHSKNGGIINTGGGGGYTLLSLSSQGQAKVTTIDGRLLHTFDFGHTGNSIVPTPEHYGYTHDGFLSAWLCGGNIISSYVPNDETIKQQQQHHHHQTTTDFINQSFNSGNNFEINMDNNNQQQQQQTNSRTNPSWLGNNNNNNPSAASSGSSSSSSSSTASSSSSSFNVIISNPNNVNLNVYQIPRRNELIFGPISSIDPIRIHRAIRSIVASSQQQVNAGAIGGGSSGSNVNIHHHHHHHHQQQQQQLLQSSSSGSGSSNSNNNRFVHNLFHHHQHHNNHSSNNQQQQNLQHPIPWHGIGGTLDISSVIGGGNSASSIRSHHHHQQRQQSAAAAARNIPADDCDDEDDDDDDDEDDDEQCNNLTSSLASNANNSMNSILSNRIIDHHTPSNSFVRKKTLFYHDHWDHSNRIDQFIDNNNGISNSTMNHPQQINRLRFSSNGAHLYAAGEGGFVRQYRRYPNLNVHCLGEVYRHRGDILDMDISPYDEFLVTASKDKTVGFICLGSPSHGWTEYYEYT